MPGHSGHRERVKAEFLARGLEGWSSHRALELLLFYALPQKDTNGLAHELVERFGSLAGVLDASQDELCKVKGISGHTAVLLKLIPALCARYEQERADLGRIVRTTQDAAGYLAPYFFGARHEMSYILCLDTKHKALGVRKVAEGSIHAAEISVRRIVEEAVGMRASALYLAHNHISNLAFPSAEDWNTTDTLRAILSSMSIELIDHIVFVDGDAVSLNQSQSGNRRPVYQFL